MAKISALTDGSAWQGTDALPAARAGANVKLTVAQLYTSPTFTGVAKFADGTAAAPSIAFSTTPATGFFYGTNFSDIAWASSGTFGGQLDAAGIILKSAGYYGWSDASTTGGNIDTRISRIAAGSAAMNTGRWSVKQGAAVASAGEVTLGSDGNRFQITGTTQIDKILVTGWQGGSIVTLHFQGSVTVTHNTANNGSFHGFRLAGAANFSATANDQLTLQYDSTASAWFEIARTVI